MAAKIFRINYKSDFILTLNSDAGWMTPFCIKFWTGAPSQAFFAQWDGETYTHCAPVAGEPTKLLVQFDDHHLPIGDLKFQIAYHFTVADFPNDTEDEVINPASITTEIDGETYQVMLDFTGETAPEIEFSLPAYANEAQRIANEQQRIAAEETRIDNEAQRIRNEQTRINQEEARVREFATLKRDAQEATTAANNAAALANQKAQLAADKAQLAADKAALAQDAANLANQKAQLAADKAALAQDAANLANQKAQLAADKAALAQDAADLANQKAQLAQQKAEYAQSQGDYAKQQGDYAKEQGDYAKRKGDDAAAQMQQQAQAFSEAQAARQTSYEQAEGTESGSVAGDGSRWGAFKTNEAARDAKVDAKVADITNLQEAVAEGAVYDVSAQNPTAGPNNDGKWGSLSALLSDANLNTLIPTSVRRGGMSIKFVCSSDNKYVQFRFILSTFTDTQFANPANWQGTDDEPVAGSENLVKSGGVFERINNEAFRSSNYRQVVYNGTNNTLQTGTLVVIANSLCRIVPKKTTWNIQNVNTQNTFFGIQVGGTFIVKLRKDIDNFPLKNYYDIYSGVNGEITISMRADEHQSVEFDVYELDKNYIIDLDKKINNNIEDLHTIYKHTFIGENNTLKEYTQHVKAGHSYVISTNVSTWALNGSGSQYIIYIDNVQKCRYYPEDFPNNPVIPYKFTAEQDGILKVSFRAAANTSVNLTVNDSSELRTDVIGTQIEELLNKTYGAYYAELYGNNGSLQTVVFNVNEGGKYKLVPDKTTWSMSNIPSTNGVFDYYVGDTRVLIIRKEDFTGLASSYDITIPDGVTTVKVDFRGDVGVSLGLKLLSLDESIGDTFNKEILEIKAGLDEYKNGGGDILRLHPKEQILPILVNFQKTESYTASIPYGDNKNFVLMWFSDIHLRDNNTENIQRDRLIQFYTEYAQYNNNIMIDDVLASGDIINRQGDSFENLWASTDAKSYLMCIGNHEVLLDTPPQVGGVDMKIPYFSKKYCYDTYFKNLVQYTGITIEENQSYWYKDYSSCKLRLIALDFMHWNDVPTLVNDTVLTQYPDGGTGDNGEQEQWLEDTLNETLDNTKDCYGYSVLIVIHCPLPMSRMECSFTSLTPTNVNFNNNNVAQIVDTFQNTNGGKFVAYLCGHTHVDMVGTVNGYQDQFIRTIDCTRIAQKNGDIAKVYDTNGQDLFELVCVDTNKKLISFNRVGCNWDRYGRHLGALVYDYDNRRIVFNN